MRRIVTKLFAAFFIIFLLSFFSQCFADEENKVYIKAFTDKMIYYLNDTVKITVYIVNESDEPIEVIEPAIDRRSLFIDIVQPDNKKEKLSVIYGLSLNHIRLYPQKRIKFQTEFGADMLGEYTINVLYYGYGNKKLKCAPVKIYTIRRVEN